MSDPGQRWRDRLRASGLRVTRRRLQVLGELERHRASMSHAEITDRLRGVDRATIYRNLMALVDVGVLVRVQLPDRVWRYRLPELDRVGDHGGHPHFICMDCGEMRCLQPADVTVRRPALGGEVSEIQLRGRCADCLDVAG